MTLNVDFMVSTFFAALAGTPVTLGLTVAAFLVAFPVGFAIAVVRTGTGHRVLKALFGVYLSYTRGTPIIVQILITYALLPDVLQAAVQALGIPFDVNGVPGIVYAVVLFAFWTTAFLSETLRAGLESVGTGQLEAAVTNGLSRRQAYLRIVAPQVVSSMLPVICTNVNSLIKMTSLSFAMAVPDITAIAQVQAGTSLSYLEAYLVIAVIYLIICLAVELAFKVAERRVALRREGRVKSTRHAVFASAVPKSHAQPAVTEELPVAAPVETPVVVTRERASVAQSERSAVHA